VFDRNAVLTHAAPPNDYRAETPSRSIDRPHPAGEVSSAQLARCFWNAEPAPGYWAAPSPV